MSGRATVTDNGCCLDMGETLIKVWKLFPPTNGSRKWALTIPEWFNVYFVVISCLFCAIIVDVLLWSQQGMIGVGGGVVGTWDS